jgi:hypothetical protein
LWGWLLSPWSCSISVSGICDDETLFFGVFVSAHHAEFIGSVGFADPFKYI